MSRGGFPYVYTRKFNIMKMKLQLKKKIAAFAALLFLMPMSIWAEDINPNLGDVNGDGAVNVTDVTIVVDYILGNENNNFIFENADLNYDEEINVTDVTALVNLILTGKNNTTFDVDTNLDDDIGYGGGGSGPARVRRINN